MRFSGKAALVSGAGSGIGKAIAVAFAREGAEVALLGRTEEKLLGTASLLPPGRSLILPARHDDAGESEDAVRKAADAFGRIDVLVNVAGIYRAGDLAATEPSVWSEVLAANLTGPYALTRAALPHLRRFRGSIVNVSSSLGLQPIGGAAAYCAAKAGLNMLTRTTALEEARNGVRANAVCPGIVDTPIHAGRVGETAVAEFLGKAASLHPLGRVGKPEDVAALVLFLASEESAWTTGAVIPIDGGISLT